MTPIQLRRFISNIDTTQKHNGSCWIWTGPRFRSGYGMFHYAGRHMRAHRVAWFVMVGKIPKGMHVCHVCDVPLCVNPSHLWVGDHEQNMKDMVRKGRHRSNPLRGHLATNAKLREVDIIPIGIEPRFHKEIAKDYGVSAGLISRVKTRRAWAHV